MADNNFEVGQRVLIRGGGYMNGIGGMIIDASASADPYITSDMYTVEVDEGHGTHYFYADTLIPTITENPVDKDWWMS